MLDCGVGYFGHGDCVRLLHILKYKFLEWKWDRVLKKSGCTNWESYFRTNDPDFNKSGKNVKEKLVGYQYVAVVNSKHLDRTVDGMWGEMFYGETVAKWCDQTCRKKYRWQWERVTMDHDGQYAPDGYGIDELFFGFKDERDYFLFLLRWS